MIGDKFHVMRDHPNHNHPMLGGMWGCVSGAIPHAIEAITTGARNASMSKIVTFQGDGFNEDQRWLKNVVWPIAQKSCTQHDECDDRLKYGEHHSFPVNRKDKWDFVGNKYTAAGEPVYSIESR